MRRAHLRAPTVAALGAVAMIGAACSPSTERTPLPDARDVLTTTTVTTPPTTLATAPVTATGRLLVLGHDYEITIVDPDGSDPVVLATAAEGELERGRPAWSNDGTRVAWTEGVFGEATELVVATADGRETTRTPVPFPSQYTAWAPGDATIALMGNDLEGDLRLVAQTIATGQIVDIGTGAPLYFDWDPDGDAILLHVEDRLEIVEIADGARTAIETDGDFRVGTFVGGSLVYAMDAGVGEALVVDEGTAERPRAVLRFAAPAAFVAHPEGDQIAVLARGARESQAVVELNDPLLPTLVPSRLEILDLATRSLHTIVEAPAIAWFWSPDGSRLLYSIPDTTSGSVELQWWVYENGESTQFASFTPNGDYARGYLAFFDQFARTTRFWSPTSDAFTYAGGDTTESGIWVQVVGEPRPHLVASGKFAVWSPVE